MHSWQSLLSVHLNPINLTRRFYPCCLPHSRYTQANKKSVTTVYRKLTCAIAIVGMGVTGAQASGLEYSKQTVLPFFEEGDYIEFSSAHIDPDIEGLDIAGGVNNPETNNHIDDMMDNFNLYSAAIKLAPSDDTAIAVLYDEPFGVDTKYQKGSEFANDMGATEARVDTNGVTLLGGGRITNGLNHNMWLYGGLEYQKADGFVTLAQNFDGDPIYYTLDTNESSEAIMPVIGVAYEIPDIMLRAAVTWRGEGKHDLAATESLTVDNALLNGKIDYNDIPLEIKNAVGLPDVTFGDTRLEFTTPQSVNLDFQTGLSEKYQLLGMLNARWVEWTAFDIAPQGITEVVGEPLAEYKKNAYAVEVALGKQLTPKLSGEIRLGYDGGTGEPLSLLGPYDEIKTIAIGGNYELTDNVDIAAGAQYFRFEGGRAYSELPIDTSLDDRAIASFEDGDGFAIGTRIGYHF